MMKSLRRKFVLITMLLVSVVLIAVFFGIWFYNKTSMERQSYRTLERAVERGDPKEAWFEVGGDVPPDFQRDPVFVVSVSSDGSVALVSSDRVHVGDEELRTYVTRVLAERNDRGELAAYDLRYLVWEEHDGSARIAFAPLSLERDMLGNVALITGICVAAAFVVFLGVSILLSRWALRPVEYAWAQQSRFMADASHELKTPLTIILANTGILKNDPGMGEEQRTWLDSTEKEAHRMKGLVTDMLFLTQRDDGSPRVDRTSQNYSAIVETSALAFESVAFERGLSLEVAVEPDIRVLCDAAQIRQLIAILVDNAVKYARDGSEIHVRLLKRQGHAVLTVFNEGDVIPKEQLRQLFDRFFRRDASRATEGSGLGLSIAKTIAQEHRGRITASSDRTGTVFTVELPVE